MDLDKIKQQWGTLGEGIDKLNHQIDAEEVSRKVTARQALVRKYSAMSVLGFVCAITTPYLFIVLCGSIYIAIAGAVYFMIAGFMDLYMQYLVKKINPATMTLAEVSARASRARRFHHIFQIILIPLCIILVSAIAYTMLYDEWALLCIAVGVILGLALGVKMYFKMMHSYKRLVDAE